MKKIILIPFLMFIIFLNTKAQQANHLYVTAEIDNAKTKAATPAFFSLNSDHNYVGSSPQKDHDFYLHRSKNQRIVGWATLGGGLLLGVAGILAANSENTYRNGSSSLPGVLFVASAAAGVVSIPFMVLASVNKHKAKVLLNTQKTGFGVPPGISRSIAGITILIPLGS